MLPKKIATRNRNRSGNQKPETEQATRLKQLVAEFANLVDQKRVALDLNHLEFAQTLVIPRTAWDFPRRYGTTPTIGLLAAVLFHFPDLGSQVLGYLENYYRIAQGPAARQEQQGKLARLETKQAHLTTIIERWQQNSLAS